MKKRIISLFGLILCLFSVVSAHADTNDGPCWVTEDADVKNNQGAFRYITEEILFSSGVQCTTVGRQDGLAGVENWVIFQTSETSPANGDEVDVITLDPVWGSMEFKPTVDTLVGNYSHAALTDSEAELNYVINPADQPGYSYQEDGLTIKDWGRVVIDARNYPAYTGGSSTTTSGRGRFGNIVAQIGGFKLPDGTFVPLDEQNNTTTGGNLEEALPFICKDGAANVYLRNMVIFTSRAEGQTGITKELLLGGTDKTSCFKNGGSVYVCNGNPVLDDNGQFIDPATVTRRDQWCEGETDVTTDTWYQDTDGDGYGDDSTATESTDKPGDDYTTTGGDCDDTQSTVYPGADELCDGLDNDCDGLVDEGVDCDGDGYTEDNDCDDSDATVNPGADEICDDGKDNDCDGDIDSADSDCDTDKDDDGYDVDDDCDDNDPNVNPGADEICDDGIDNDCDGDIDPYDSDCVPDNDNDGYNEDDDCDDNDASVNPGADEICDDGKDNDCDGAVDSADTGDCSENNPDEDNDGDGYCEAEVCTDGSTPGDCDDTDATISPEGTDICGDGIDQDCSGEDRDCAPEVCNDDADNDEDGLIDCKDSDCASYYECQEGGVPEEICNDGLDNEGDGYTDCFDKDCMFDVACLDETETSCGDGFDNDGDGLIDCEDLEDCGDYIVETSASGEITTCLDLQVTPVGPGGFIAGGAIGGCSCDLTRQGSGQAKDMLPMAFGFFLIAGALALRIRASQKEENA